jgi:hypothetical protein
MIFFPEAMVASPLSGDNKEEDVSVNSSVYAGLIVTTKFL